MYSYLCLINAHVMLYIVVTMYLDTCKIRVRSKTYTRTLLRESYRQAGKVKHRTIANLSKCSERELAAIRLALKHKHELSSLKECLEPATGLRVRQGPSVGALATLQGLAGQLGIVRALGTDRQGKLALWQVIARVIDQGSRLSAVRLATTHACCDLLDLDAFDEDDLYANLAWLSEHQSRIEGRLFDALHGQAKPQLFLYDVTSSYLEGTKNAFGAFGYNRDGKRGKMQIVIGLLCDANGVPLSIEVFAGNTNDPKTVASQIRKVTARFGGEEVTFVGDRGMLKSVQIEDLASQGFHYITAITKPQIETLLGAGILQMELFDQDLAEVVGEGVRYVVRRNPRRAQELAARRADKLRCVQALVQEANARLAAHPRARIQTALNEVRRRIEKLRLGAWLATNSKAHAREIMLQIDEHARAEDAKLDGCYVLKTDLKAAHADKQLVHDRYKDLALVEGVFRTSKTVELEMRPIHVRREESTRGHALVVMLAYRLARELSVRWRSLDLTVQEGVDQLSTLCATEVLVGAQPGCHTIPEPRPQIARLIELAGVRLPKIFRSKGIKVATRKKLPSNRSKR